MDIVHKNHIGNNGGEEVLPVLEAVPVERYASPPSPFYKIGKAVGTAIALFGLISRAGQFFMPSTRDQDQPFKQGIGRRRRHLSEKKRRMKRNGMKE